MSTSVGKANYRVGARQGFIPLPGRGCVTRKRISGAKIEELPAFPRLRKSWRALLPAHLDAVGRALRQLLEVVLLLFCEEIGGLVRLGAREHLQLVPVNVRGAEPDRAGPLHLDRVEALYFDAQRHDLVRDCKGERAVREQRKAKERTTWQGGASKRGEDTKGMRTRLRPPPP